MNKWMAVMVILLLTGVLAADVVAGRGRGDSRHEGPYVQPHQRTYPGGHLFTHDRVPGHDHPHTGKRTPGGSTARARGVWHVSEAPCT